MGRPVLLSKIDGPGAASARMPRRWAVSGSSGPGFSSISPQVRRLPRPVKGTIRESRIVGHLWVCMVFVDIAMNPQRTQVVEDWPSAHWSAQLCCLAHSEGFARSVGEVVGEGCLISLQVVEVQRFLRPGGGGGGLFRRARSLCQNGEGFGLGTLLLGRNPSSR